MESIFFKDGVYVIVESENKEDSCIFQVRHKPEALLYGGRVRVFTDSFMKTSFTIDGIKLIEFKGISKNENLDIYSIIAFLNGIEANGVESFLKNYKQSLEFIYSELKEINQKNESQLISQNENLNIKKILLEIENIKGLILIILFLLFSLHVNMPAGLENERMNTISQSILESFM